RPPQGRKRQPPCPSPPPGTPRIFATPQFFAPGWAGGTRPALRAHPPGPRQRVQSESTVPVLPEQTHAQPPRLPPLFGGCPAHAAPRRAGRRPRPPPRGVPRRLPL